MIPGASAKPWTRTARAGSARSGSAASSSVAWRKREEVRAHAEPFDLPGEARRHPHQGPGPRHLAAAAGRRAVDGEGLFGGGAMGRLEAGVEQVADGGVDRRVAVDEVVQRPPQLLLGARQATGEEVGEVRSPGQDRGGPVRPGARSPRGRRRGGSGRPPPPPAGRAGAPAPPTGGGGGSATARRPAPAGPVATDRRRPPPAAPRPGRAPPPRRLALLGRAPGGRGRSWGGMGSFSDYASTGGR